MRALGIASTLFLVMVMVGCTTVKIPATKVRLPVPQLNPLKWWDKQDLSDQERVEAFRRLIQTLQREYPYTQHKGHDWLAIEDRYLPAIEQASVEGDDAAYYYTLRSFAEQLRDANISMSEVPAHLAVRFGGGYGMDVITLDDQRVLVRTVRRGWPADLAGIRPMDEIVSWNAEPIRAALLEAPMLWGGQPPATNERRAVRRHAGLMRDPVGSEARVVFRPAGSVATKTVRLTAVEEPWSALEEEGTLDAVEVEYDPALESRILDGQIGYIQIHFFAQSVTTPFPARAFRNALRAFDEARVRGVVIDLRGNSGGLEAVAAEMAGHLAESPAMYRQLLQFESDTGRFAVSDGATVRVTPAEPYVYRPVVVLIDGQTSRAAEGFAWFAREVRGAKLVGMAATRGVTQSPEQEVVLPGGIKFYYPMARRVGPDGAIRFETDARGSGGLQPDVRIPTNETNVRAMYVDGKDLELGQAIAMLKGEG